MIGIQWAIVLTVCTAGAPGTPDNCADYVADVLPSYQECVAALPEYGTEKGLAVAACETATPAPEYTGTAP